MKYLSTSDGSPRRHAGTPPRTTTRALVSFFSAATVSATLSRCFSQVPCSNTMSGLICRTSDKTLSFIARQFGVPAMSAFSAGMQELEVSCAMPKLRVSCALRRPGSSAPAVESPQIRTSGRRSRSTQVSANVVSLAEIEQAFMKPPLEALRRHAGHGADFRRQPEVEAAPPNDGNAGDRDHRHAGAEAEHLAPARDGRNGTVFRQTDRSPRPAARSRAISIRAPAASAARI